ncbi:hypothetical protein RvY_07412-2 [Ramazzottius varieornatus]|uniref:Receptor ligand binding region domain-containing protein n=1 Tax=Ramazzottius varieornatus TaxID=947166 RepID=A0A1D1VAI4_RAMVA|nr:hypothetical protein RvY_07412-2 [Ramazzottius varieornatus]
MDRRAILHFEFFLLFLHSITTFDIPVRRSVQDVANGIVPPVLTVCFVIEDDSYFGNYGRLAAAVDLGIEHANAFVMPNTTKLQVAYQSSGTSCTRTLYSAVLAMLDMMDKGTTCDMYLGTTCAFTTAALYGFAVKYSAPIFGNPSSGISAIQPDSLLSDFRLLTQPAFGYSDCADFLIQLAERLNYSSLVIFRDDSYSFFTTFADQILRFFREKRPSIYQTTYTSAFRSKRYSVSMIKPLLSAANARSRVFLLFAHATGVRNIMIAAHQLGYISGDHVFFVLQLYELEYWGQVDATVGDGFDDAMKEAYSSVLLLSFHEIAEQYDHQFEATIKTNARNRYGYSFNPLETLDPVLLGHYDSVMLYATAVATMMAENNANFTNGYEIASRLNNRTFQGVRGSTIIIGEDGQRDKNYKIQFYDSKTEEFVPYLLYLQNTISNELFRIIRPLKWPSGQLPPNEPLCGFRNDNCRQEGLSSSTLAIAVVIPLLVLSGLSIGAGLVFYKMWKIRMNFNPNWWKVLSDELSVKDNRPNGVEGSKRTLRSQSSAGTQRTDYSSYVCELFATYKGTLVGLVDVSEQKKAVTKELLAELTLVGLSSFEVRKITLRLLAGLSFLNVEVNECFDGDLLRNFVCR